MGAHRGDTLLPEYLNDENKNDHNNCGLFFNDIKINLLFIIDHFVFDS